MPSGGGLRRISSMRFCTSSGVICGGAAASARRAPAAAAGPPGPPGPAAGTAVDHHHRLRILVLHHQRQVRVLIDEQAQRAAGLFLGFENVGLAVGRFGDAGVDPRRAGVGEQRRGQPLHLHAHAAHARFVQLFRRRRRAAAGARATGPAHHDRMPPPMPPRFCVSSHAVVPLSTDGALDRRAADHAAHRHLFDAMHLVGPRERDRRRVPSMSRPPIERRNGPSAVRPLRPAILSSPPSALRAAAMMPATRSCAASGDDRDADRIE